MKKKTRDDPLTGRYKISDENLKKDDNIQSYIYMIMNGEATIYSPHAKEGIDNSTETASCTTDKDKRTALNNLFNSRAGTKKDLIKSLNNLIYLKDDKKCTQYVDEKKFKDFKEEFSKGRQSTDLIVSCIGKFVANVAYRAGVTVGALIDALGSTLKVVGKLDPTKYVSPFKEDRGYDSERLGVVAGIGKIISEAGVKVAQAGTGAKRMTDFDISSPVERLISHAKKEEGKSR